jgi:hypothetical protein
VSLVVKEGVCATTSIRSVSGDSLRIGVATSAVPTGVPTIKIR